jgi:uncharacterized protein YdhG (YjbR/CyaY superfamily)
MATTITIDQYIATLPAHSQDRIQQMRDLIQTCVPDAVESMSYGIIGYKLNGKPLLYIGGFKNHVGLYATPNGHEAFKEEFSKYKQGKGSVQFPHSENLPLKLIKQVVLHRRKVCLNQM